MTPDRSRAPKIISKEPIKNRNMARAIALYGTFGGLFLNFRVLFDKILTIGNKEITKRKCQTAVFRYKTIFYKWWL